jgi:DNA polymerase III alpha subunit
MGVFQIESPGMRAVLKKVRARDFGTVTAASSVIRPGPKDAGMMRAWIRRHRGLEPAQYLHPRLREVLSETHGILMYQEDVLKVAQAIAGFSLGRADLMRRSMSGKRPEIPLARMEDEFLEGAARNGVNPAAARAIWAQTRSFAGYAFCKAHSASYTVLSFQAAWLKAHHPAAFMGAVLANGGGFYDRAAYVAEARRLGLRVLLPSMNQSETHWTGGGDGVRCGLGQIKNLRDKAAKEIVDERGRRGPYKDFVDALRRLPGLEKSEWENLVLTGACDDFLTGEAAPPNGAPARGPRFRCRPQLLWFLDRWFRDGLRETAVAGRFGRQLDLLDGLEETQRGNNRPGERDDEAPPELPDFSWEKKYDQEAELLEVTVRCHPLERFRALLPDEKDPSICRARDLDRMAGRRVRMVGWLVTSRRLRTSKGTYMKFLTLEDLSGLYEAILFDKAYQQYGAQTLTRGPYLIEGKVELEEGHSALHASLLTVLRP